MLRKAGAVALPVALQFLGISAGKLYHIPGRFAENRGFRVGNVPFPERVAG